MFERKDVTASWTALLHEIDGVRRRLHCTKSTAWYRGHEAEAWGLLPTLIRNGAPVDTDDGTLIRGVTQRAAEAERRLQDSLASRTRHKPSSRGGNVQAYREADRDAHQAREQLAQLRRRLVQLSSVVIGERDIFDEYSFQTGKLHTTASWETLAEMRHHGIPTRLLDWTDQLEIALYFALNGYRQALSQHGVEGVDVETSLAVVAALPRPRLWVLNPYQLARKASGRGSIWDFTRVPRYDYYQALLVWRTWPFDEPVPMYPPGQIARVRSQSGFFTVFGNRKRALQDQIPSGWRCLESIVIEPKAALFALRYLDFYRRLTEFDVFRDLDSLGRLLRAKLEGMVRAKLHSPDGFTLRESDVERLVKALRRDPRARSVDARGDNEA